MWARVHGSQRSRNIAVFGHRFCGGRSLRAPVRYVKEEPPLFPTNLANLSSPPRVLLPLPARTPSFLPSIATGGSNKSAGFYSCLSDILYNPRAGPPPGASASPASPAPTRTRAIRYERRQRCVYAQSTRSGGLQVEAPCSGPYLLDSLHAARVFMPDRPVQTTDRPTQTAETYSRRPPL